MLAAAAEGLELNPGPRGKGGACARPTPTHSAAEPSLKAASWTRWACVRESC